MRSALAAVSLLALVAGCGPEPVLFIRIEAPLVVPDACDAVTVKVTRPGGAVAYDETHDLTSGPSFPLGLSLRAVDPRNLDVALSVRAEALKGQQPAAPWASAERQVTVQHADRVTQVVLQLCDCPP